MNSRRNPRPEYNSSYSGPATQSITDSSYNFERENDDQVDLLSNKVTQLKSVCFPYEIPSLTGTFSWLWILEMKCKIKVDFYLEW